MVMFGVYSQIDRCLWSVVVGEQNWFFKEHGSFTHNALMKGGMTSVPYSGSFIFIRGCSVFSVVSYCKWKFNVIIVEALQNCGVLGHESTLKIT